MTDDNLRDSVYPMTEDSLCDSVYRMTEDSSVVVYTLQQDKPLHTNH
jgi:hypothetical protein